MRWHSSDHRDPRQGRRWPLVNRSFYLHGVPLLSPLCRIFGHRPVVDGTADRTIGTPDGSELRLGSRWVACSRCRVRADPQGSLDPQMFTAGQPYRGPWSQIPADGEARWEALKSHKTKHHPPGTLTSLGSADVGGQLIVGPCLRPHSVGFQIKVGNPGSENAFGGWVHFGWLGSLYWHTGHLGRGLAQRLNHDLEGRYISRVTGLELELSQFRWQLWADRNRWSRDDPAWMQGSVDLNPLNHLLGRRRHEHTDVAEVHRIVRLPEGGPDRLTRLRLQQVTSVRARGPHRRMSWWEVSWTVEGAGIALSADRFSGGTSGAHVRVDDVAVRRGTWPSAAVAAITAQVVQWRTSSGWEPTGAVPAVDCETAVGR